MTSNLVLFPAMFVVGSASGATTVLRPLIVVELVGAAPFAATNARIQRASTIARAAAPLVLGIAATAFGWPIAWAGCLAAFAPPASATWRSVDPAATEHQDPPDTATGSWADNDRIRCDHARLLRLGRARDGGVGTLGRPQPRYHDVPIGCHVEFPLTATKHARHPSWR